MRKWKGLKSFSVMAVAAVMLAAAPLTVQAAELPKGIMVDDMDIGGMSEGDARKRIEDYVENLAGQTVTLDIKGKETVATAKELGAFWSNAEEVGQVIGQVAGGNLIAKYMKKKDLELEPVNLTLGIEVDESKVAEFVRRQSEGMADEPQNATIVRADGQFIVTPGISGTTVDVEATAKVLDEAMADGLDSPIRASAIVVEREPDITTAALESIQDVLGTFSTDFSSSGAARAKNLQVGSEKINGALLLPGETLSGYECMQPFTTANGYYTAAAYENGMVVDSVGGGVCQIATTLYNASLMAELEITQRQNHSMLVAYVRPSKDAAIAGTFKDIKVTNNYSTPIYVEGGTDGRTLFFTIYGKETRPENRTVEYVSETLGSTDPGAPTTRPDPSLAPGTTRQIQAAHRGLRSRLWKVVYLDGVETERTILHTDNYMASKAIVLVGPEAPAPVETAPADAGDAGADTGATEAPAPSEGLSGGPGVSPIWEPTQPITAAPEETQPAASFEAGPESQSGTQSEAEPGALPEAGPETQPAAPEKQPQGEPETIGA